MSLILNLSQDAQCCPPMSAGIFLASVSLSLTLSPLTAQGHCSLLLVVRWASTSMQMEVIVQLSGKEAKSVKCFAQRMEFKEESKLGIK